MPTLHRPRIIAATAIFAATVLSPARLKADSTYSLKTSVTPLNQALVQGSDGTITFDFINDQTFPVVVDSIGTVSFLMDTVDFNPEVKDGDKCPKADCVTKAVRTGGLCGAGSILAPGKSCDEIVGFVTDDARRPLDPDKDYGAWFVLSIISRPTISSTQR